MGGQTNNENRRRTLEVLAAILVALLALGSAIGTFVLLPYRMTAAETAIKTVQEQRSADHDVLTEINTNVKRLLREDERRKP